MSDTETCSDLDNKLRIYKGKFEAAKKAGTLRKFRVVRGKHHEGGVTYSANTKKNIVESISDLNKYNFGPSSIKFVEIKDGDPQEVVATAEPSPQEDSSDDFANYTVDELKSYAEDNEIDLDGATKKADILAAIELHLEG